MPRAPPPRRARGGPRPPPPTRASPGASGSARSDRATARAGYTCPPVPPATISTRIDPVPPWRRLARDGKQDADRGQAHGERGAASADERQRDPGDGQQRDDDADVDERLDRDEDGDAGGEHPAGGGGEEALDGGEAEPLRVAPRVEETDDPGALVGVRADHVGQRGKAKRHERREHEEGPPGGDEH